ncbi:MAG: ParB N-terminal domain-containing protein [Lachnospiraceae bacterium]|nr:ParB N-terminal domain-containing protein [Lachnospiraceae bacterium]
MKYGTLTLAKAYHDNGKIEEWLQLFLRNDGKNLALADGLLLEKREYFGLCKLNMSCFKDIKEGAPEYLSAENDVEYFFWIVENMKNSLGDWDAPPLIVEYRDEKFFVNDGRHRLEMYRQLRVDDVDAVLWTTGEENAKKLQEVLK